MSTATATLRGVGLGRVNAGTLTQVGYLARRSITRTVRQPIMFIPSLVFPLFLLAVNSSGLGAATSLPGFPTDSYLTFALGLTFMQGALFATMGAGQSIAGDIQHGFFNRLQLTPLRGPALIAGQLAGVTLQGLVQGIAYLLIALAFGAHLEAGPAGVLVLFALSALVGVAFGSLGLAIGLRTGNGEAVQGVFPLMFVLLFLSSGALPRDLIENDWFQVVATINPVSYLIEGFRSLFDQRLGRRGAGARLRRRARRARLRHVGGDRGAAGKDGAHVNPFTTRFGRAARVIAWRQLHVMLTKPSLIMPSVVFPLFFFAAFAGGLSAVDQAPNFDYPNYTTFQYVFVLMQSAIFGGVFTGFAIAADFEFGFARRMLLATRNRSALIAGYVISARWRARCSSGPWSRSSRCATGAEIAGSVGDLLGILAIAVMLNFAATLFASGMAMRFRTLQAAPLIQLPGLPDHHDRARVRAAGPDRGLGGDGRRLQPDDRDARGRAQPDHRRARPRPCSRSASPPA